MSSEAGAAPDMSVRAVLQRHEHSAIVLLLLVGLVERAVWVSGPGRLNPFICEMQNVAATFARTGVVGDAYFVGQGPTAHVGPVMPLIAGSIYRAFGVGTLTSEIVLLGLALTCFATTLMAFYAAFRRLGLGVGWRLAALAAALVLPLHFKFEAQSLRIWEGALTSAVLACSLLLALRLDARDRLSARDFVGPALLAGFLALLSPPAALGGYAAFGLLALKMAPVRRWPAVALVTAAGLAVFITPWAIRNDLALHRSILTRSNFPLEHAIAFHPAAVSPSDPRAVYVQRIRSIHPYSTEPVSAVRDEVKRIGELAYMARLQAETSAWERENPGAVVRIAAGNFLQFWFPPGWWFHIYNNDTPFIGLRVAFYWATALAAFGALAWGISREPLGPRLYVACILLLPALPYALVQPMQRYRYLVVVLTFFLAAEFASRVWSWAARRRAPEGSPQPGAVG